jgi:tetratricopeptide (TPR) repeat protein
VASLEVRSAALALTALTGDDKSRAAQHARGLALLAIEDVDGSIAALERAGSAPGAGDGSALADLSAARLARFRGTGDRDDAQRALDAADAALRVAPRLAAGLFNRAAALDALGDRERAADAWRAYLDVDPSSPWSEEVRRRLAR